MSDFFFINEKKKKPIIIDKEKRTAYAIEKYSLNSRNYVIVKSKSLNLTRVFLLLETK